MLHRNGFLWRVVPYVRTKDVVLWPGGTAASQMQLDPFGSVRCVISEAIQSLHVDVSVRMQGAVTIGESERPTYAVREGLRSLAATSDRFRTMFQPYA
jgi:hypothetical protein